MPQVLHVNVGPARPLRSGDREVLSGIVKRPVDGAVAVHALGLTGDEQAGSAHGGLAKAVYAYPAEHYAFWQTVRAQAGVAPWGEALPPGSLGENLTLAGLQENQVWIGDVLQFADCTLAVSEPRLPSLELDAVMGFEHASRLMVQSAWCGFYLAVREPGRLRAGDAFTVVPGPREVGITELFRARTGLRRGA